MLLVVNLELMLTIFLAIALFSMGIYVGRFFCSHNQEYEKPMSFLKTASNKPLIKNSITIDDTKVVTKIDTDGMEKKYSQMTKDSVKENTIKSSVNKLKSMKGK